MNKLYALLARHNASLYLTMLAVFALMAYINGDKFLSAYNIGSMAYQLPIIGLLSVGMMISMLTGGINLSIIANANLNGIIIWQVLEFLTGPGRMKEAGTTAIVIAILAGFMVSGLVGLINGFLIAVFEIPDILVTLGTMTLIGGLNIVITRGYTITGFPASLNWIGNGQIYSIPVPILLFLLAVIITSVILYRTRFGFSLYMMGANATAARYSGVNLTRVIVAQYILSACFASLTSLVMIGQLNSIKSNYAESYLLVAVLASFLGGVDPLGGFGRIGGVLAATVILQIISSGLNLMRMDPFMITAMWGAIIIIIIFAKALTGVIKRHWQPTSQSGK
ncbi:MAG: ABC transporter permease [Planctomycetota bacterium]|jgi:simple sugar transport system permease protein|nr:ABC transporter permease [Planctomycetota bacterium]